MPTDIDYNMCLWKHAKSVVTSPRGVVYACTKCEPQTLSKVSKPGKPRQRKRTYTKKVRQNSELVK